jgi:hypothetical protein
VTGSCDGWRQRRDRRCPETLVTSGNKRFEQGGYLAEAPLFVLARLLAVGPATGEVARGHGLFPETAEGTLGEIVGHETLITSGNKRFEEAPEPEATSHPRLTDLLPPPLAEVLGDLLL